MTRMPSSGPELTKIMGRRLEDYHFWMIGHGHIDPVWRWTWEEGYQEVFATFRSVLDRMKEYPEICFVGSSPQFYAWVEEADPAMFEEIRQRVQEGRWNLVGGWWIEPDANLPLGESIARLGLYGQRYFQEKFGRRATIGFNPDTFGHPWTFPQILQQHGLDAYVFMRPMPHEMPSLSAPLFRWEGLDGTQILTIQIVASYNCAEVRDAEDDRLAPRLRDCMERYDRDQPNLLEIPIFYGMGNHGGGPTVASIEKINRTRHEYPGMRFGSLEDFRARLRPHEKRLPVVHEELLHHARGCYSACLEVKLGNRRAETALLRAEKIAAAASWLADFPYPADRMRHGWKKVLFNQFHDIVAGSSVKKAYQDARDDQGYATSLAKEILARGLQIIAQQVDTAQGQAGKSASFLLFNAHAWPVREKVELELERAPYGKGTPVLLDAENRAVSFQSVLTDAPDVGSRLRLVFEAELPAFGYSLYRVDFSGDSSAPAVIDPVTASGHVMENGLLRAEFDPRSGALISLYDKQGRRELLAGPAASPIVLDDPDDTWGHDVAAYDQEEGRFGQATLTVCESGPERARMEIETTYHGSRILQNFSLWRDSTSLDVQVTVDWREKQKVLKLGFASVLAHGAVTASVPYGYAERPMDGTEMPMQTWLSLSGKDKEGSFGLALFTDGLGGYSAAGGELRLTVLHDTIWSDHGRGGPRRDGYSHSYMEQGRHEFRYRLVVHQGTWREAGIARQAEVFLLPAVAYPVHHHPGQRPRRLSLLELDAPHSFVPAVKWSEDGNGWIVRCAELQGEASSGLLRLPLWQKEVSLSLQPAEIKTLRLTSAGEIAPTNLLED